MLPYVETLAAKFGSTVTLLRATKSPGTIIAESTPGVDPVTPGVVDPAPIIGAERQEASGYLRAVADRLRGTGLATHHEQPEGPAAEAIVQRATALGADLIAMTTHGRGGLGRLMFGSVADEVLRKASCPILLVRVGEELPRTSEGAEVPIL